MSSKEKINAHGTPSKETNLISQLALSFQLGETPEKNRPSLAYLSVTIPNSKPWQTILPNDKTSSALYYLSKLHSSPVYSQINYPAFIGASE